MYTPKVRADDCGWPAKSSDIYLRVSPLNFSESLQFHEDLVAKEIKIMQTDTTPVDSIISFKDAKERSTIYWKCTVF